jgi:hypothetical protein
VKVTRFATRIFALAALAALTGAVTGCGRPLNVKTAPGFVELREQSDFAYRATSPDGVVFGVRVIDDEARGDLSFWTHALTLQMHDVDGYALLETRDVTSKDGTPGKLLRFGHDEGNKPFAYWLGVYMAQGRLFVAEAGGAKAALDDGEKSQRVERMFASLELRCGSIVAPVLASRTCNRW